MAGFGVLDSFNYIQQQGEKGRARGQENRLAQLSQQAYGAQGAERNALVGQMVGVNPAAGMAMGDKLQTNDDAKAKRYGGAARYMLQAIKSGNMAQAQGAYMATMPAWQELAGGRPIPPQFDEQNQAQMLPMLHQIIAAAEGSQGAEPSGLREFNAMTQGLSPEDKLRAQRVNLGLDGRASTAGYQQVKFTDAQGRDRVGVLNGRTGVIDLPDGTSFNPQTGQTMQTQPEGGMPQGQQRAPGEVPFSIDPSLPPQVQASIRANEPQWAQASDQSQVQIPQQQPQGGDVFTGRPAEQQAGLTAAAQEQAKIDAEIANYQRMTDLQVGRESALARADQGIKPTKAQEAVDTQYGKEYVEFIQGGAADANKALTELEGVLRQLKRGDNLTGPVLGVLPNAIKTRTHPDAMAAQETVESTVQRSLRVILGAQFTEKEGERLIARAFNPSLPETYNTPRVQLLFNQLKEGFENKAAAARFYEKNGTLRGFTGKLPSWGDFNPDGAPKRGGQGGKDRAPTGNVDDLLGKYGIR